MPDDGTTAEERWGKRKPKHRSYFNTVIPKLKIPDATQIRKQENIILSTKHLVLNKNYYKIHQLNVNMVIVKNKTKMLLIEDYISLYDKNWLTSTAMDYIIETTICEHSISVPCDLSTTLIYNKTKFNRLSPIFSIDIFNKNFTFFTFCFNNHFSLVYRFFVDFYKLPIIFGWPFLPEGQERPDPYIYH